jgi:hypothetical protein
MVAPIIVDLVDFVHVILDRIDFPHGERRVPSGQVTTGLEPLTVGSHPRFQLDANLGGLFWDLTGGTVNLLLLDPNNSKTTVAAQIAGGGAYVDWTVPSPPPPVGTWTRAWQVVDAAGVTLVSLPIQFTVVAAP